MFNSRITDTIVDICCVIAVVMALFGLAVSPLVSIGLLQLAVLGQIYTRMPLPPNS
jgi:hypothetical protein